MKFTSLLQKTQRQLLAFLRHLALNAVIQKKGLAMMYQLYE